MFKTLQNILVLVFSCLDLDIIDDPFNLLPSFPSHHHHYHILAVIKNHLLASPSSPLSDDIISERPLSMVVTEACIIACTNCNNYNTCNI